MQYQYPQAGFQQGMVNPGVSYTAPGTFVGGATPAYTGMQGLAPRGQPSFGAGYSMPAPMVTGPLTPKITTSNLGTNMVGANMVGANMVDMAVARGQSISMQGPAVMQKGVPIVTADQNARFITGNREQALEQRVRELESIVAMKEKTIQDLEDRLLSKGGSTGKGPSKVRSPGRSGTGFRKVSESKPVIRYSATDQDDPIDVRLEEFYNSTGSAIQFRRINRGFYRFGDSIVELDIINHKLMARTEDGWNRGKFGPVEKFLMYYENIEREKAGILPEN